MQHPKNSPEFQRAYPAWALVFAEHIVENQAAQLPCRVIDSIKAKFRVGDIDQLVESLPSVHKAVALVPSITQTGMATLVIAALGGRSKWIRSSRP